MTTELQMRDKGLDDIAFHDFREKKQGIRFIISESARREILDRLLALNHQRYAEEVAQGLHDKAAPRTKGFRKKAKADQEELF